MKLERNGYDGEVKFGTEFAGRNLPHGVYVDNIGLNGVTLLKGDTERTFFLTARKWVPEQSRLFHLRADGRRQPDELACDAACSQRIGSAVAHGQYRCGVARR